MESGIESRNSHADASGPDVAPEVVPSAPSSPREGANDQDRTNNEKKTVYDASRPDSNQMEQSSAKPSFLGSMKAALTWVPPQCRYDPKNPPKFGLALNLIFALVRPCLQYSMLALPRLMSV